MSLTLYWNLGSQPARAVKCLLDLGNIKCNFVIMDIMKSQTRTKEYLTLNPLGQIPFLVDGNFKLAESNAILIYLCEKYPDQLAKYYGNTLQQRAIVNQHLSWYQNSFRPSLFKIIVLKIYGGFKQQKPVYASEIHSAEKEMMDSIQQFQQQLELGGTLYVTGSNLTVADLQYYFQITNLIPYEKTFDQFKLTTQWYNRMESTPEVMSITSGWKKSVLPSFTQTLKSIPIQEKSRL